MVASCLRQFIEFGYERKFLDHMLMRIASDEESIHHLCAANAQVLTESSRDFVELNDRIDQLREDVVTLDDRDVYATQLREIRYAEKETRITSCILNNVAVLMERINAIRPALQAFGQALKCSTAPVKALRSLCKAQENTIHLPPHLGFVTWLASSIPDIKYSLLDTCTRRVVRSLESLRVYTSQAGFGILHTVSLRSSIAVEPFASQQPDFPLLRSAETVDHSKSGKELRLRPLNNFRHIVKTLVDHPTEINNDFLFHCYVTYMAERHVQIVKSLDNLDIGTLKQMRLCIQQVVGIFGMEMFISYYVTGINAESYYDDLWKEVFPKIALIMDSAVRLVLNENDYTEVRNLLRLFAASMTVLRCESDGILGLIETLGDHYCKVLDQTLSAAIHLSLSRDLFTYHVLDNEMEQKSFLEVFEPWRKNAVNGRTDFPKTLPFSQSVPEIYALIKGHLSANISVDMDLGLDVEESLQRIVEITNTALTSNLYEQVMDIFNSGFLLVNQYVQLYQNLIQLQNCLPYLESFISRELKVHAQSDLSTVSLKPASVTFEALRLGTEQQLIGELTGYIQAVLHDSAADLGTVSETISEEAGKLMTFVKEFFESVTVLRPEFAEKAFLTIWTEIPSELETVWVYDSAVVSRDGLQQLLVDIEYYQLVIRTYAFKTVRNAGSNENEGFELLTQLIRLILSDDWAEYMGTFGQKDSPYKMVPPGSALRVVAKLNDIQLAASKSNMYLSVKTERERKHRRELLLIQLDDLATIGRVAHFKVPKSKSNITLKSTVSVVQSMVSREHM